MLARFGAECGLCYAQLPTLMSAGKRAGEKNALPQERRGVA